jgi:2-haloacid dehalogenase
MTGVERRANELLGSKRGYMIWFELFMQYCFVDNCTSKFNDFTSIAKATMQMAGRTLVQSLNENDINIVLEYLKHLPVHEGVQEGAFLPQRSGFGLGLSLAGKIIKIHKVTIDVQSDTGEGSLFVIKLPAAHSLHI